MGVLAISAPEYVTYFSIILGAEAPHSAETMISNLIVLTLRNTRAMNVGRMHGIIPQNETLTDILG
jgi:hypothetical protein